MTGIVDPYELFGIEPTGRARDALATQMLYREAMKRMHPDSSEGRTAINELETEERIAYEKALPAAMTLLDQAQQRIAGTLRASGVNVNIRKSASQTVDFKGKSFEQIDEAIVAMLMDESQDVSYPTVADVASVIKRAFEAVADDKKLARERPQSADAARSPVDWRTVVARTTQAKGDGIQNITREEAQKLVNIYPNAFKALHELQNRRPDLCLYDAVMSLIKPKGYRHYRRDQAVDRLLQALADPDTAIMEAQAQAGSIAGAIASQPPAQLLHMNLSFLKEYIHTHLIPKCERRGDHALHDTLLQMESLATKLDNDPDIMRALAAPPKTRLPGNDNRGMGA